MLVQEALEEAQTAVSNVSQLPGTPAEQIRALTIVRGQEAGEFCNGDPYELLVLYFSVISSLMLQEARPSGPQDVDLLMKILTK